MQYFNNTISKDEAIMIMKHGGKVTHEYFTSEEWVTMKNNFTVVTEDGYEIPDHLFWNDRKNPGFEKGWAILEYPTVTPKGQFYVDLTAGKKYKVTAYGVGKEYEIMSDLEMLGYFDSGNFKRANP
jgi:hypothetical protein